MFFDHETFGVDRLVVRKGDSREATQAFLAQTPLPEQVRKDILRIEHGDDYAMPGLTSAQKKDRLSRISYEHFLLEGLKADAGVLPYYLHVTDGWWGCGIDAVSALDCWGTEFPGFQGLKLEPGEAPRMGFTPAGFAATGGSDTFHFPDGNATIARLLVRSLIPAAMPGRDAARHRHRRCRLHEARSPRVRRTHSAQQHRGARSQCRQRARRSDLLARRQPVPDERAQRACSPAGT